MVEPIRPSEVLQKVKEKIQARSEVIEAFNEMIVENWDGTSSSFTQDKVIERIILKFDNDTTREDIFKNRWLDVEDLYRKQGWIVEYDKPAYNEDYDARFIFSRKGKGNR